jgi:dephospho-CoA kinase
MLRVAVTGGIGSGKSEVTRGLEARGAIIVDADVAAREVVEPGTPGFEQVIANFGVLGRDGRIDRERLASIVFSDPARRQVLNSILHPLIRDWMRDKERLAVAAIGDGAIVVHAIPLLAESGTREGYDAVIVVDVPPELQLARLVGSGRMGPGPARARMKTQASREDRLAIADIVIDNSGSLAALGKRLDEVWADLKALRGQNGWHGRG